jgi:glutathione peroxidase-family protein
MMRYWAVAVLVVLMPATAGVARAGGKIEKDIKITDKLTKDDTKDKKRGFACKIHTVKMKAGSVYTIDMVSNEFDSYLRLEDSAGKQLDEDDDSGGNLNARIIFNCPKDGDYKVICTCYSEATGNFTLTVKTAAGKQPKGTPHALLIGAVAPDFKAAFALNGKAVKLSDLKGKVVLVHFWAVQSGSSIATFERLRDLHKRFKDDGLEVVGVTYFNHELGQRFGFDKETGKVVTIEQANRQSDEAMFKAFAAHYKLEHLLLTLHKDEAMKLFEEYAVNGVPQAVLVDRNGVIHGIRAGDVEVNGATLESEIKKLLAEK